MKKLRQRGITPIEILLVLAITGIVSAITIPALLYSRQLKRVGYNFKAEHPEVVRVIKVQYNDTYDYNVVTVENRDGSVSAYTLYNESNDTAQKIADSELNKHPKAKSVNAKRVGPMKYVVTVESRDGSKYSYTIQ